MTVTANDPANTFNLVNARVERGMTTKELARVVGVHQHTMRALEGVIDRPVTPAKAKIVADFFGVKVTDVIDPNTYRSVLSKQNLSESGS